MNVRFEWLEWVVPGRSCRPAYDTAVGGLSRMTSDEEGNGPSSAFAGLTGLLPGIVSSAVPLVGTVGDSASRIWRSTCEVSHVSK